ncbi:threonine--tRNA ligase [Gammaproteobacteria bacterium]
MIKIILPDGKQLEFAKPVTVQEIAQAIGAGLAKAAIAGKVDGKAVDLSCLVERDAVVMILTSKNPEGLEILRHSATHVLAQAVCELFPGAYPTIGPAIEDGFYHDFYYPKGFSEEDLAKIEAKMHEIVQANYKFEHSLKKRTDAISYFKKRSENYKVQIVEGIPENQVSFYSQGNFTNVCRGPHIPSTGYLHAFKLTKVAGAYWRGDSHNEMLPRIYGTAWATQKELDDYLSRLERAKQNDHRLVGKKMGLFHLQEEAPGMVFWHPNGWAIYSEIKRYLAVQQTKFGYLEINTPQLLDRSLWEKSGHWEKFKEAMFITESENRTYAIRPMSCPGSIQVFKQGIKSYRDLPIRLAEFGHCYRNEASGTLSGIMRVRSFTQDDGHIFCTEDQIGSESLAFIEQLVSVYADFGFKDIIVRLATRPEKRIGSDIVWDKAEKALADVLDSRDTKWELSVGEGAFYGPKIEFSLRDSLGRVWQCGTLQVDFSMPERLGAYYINEDGERRPPVMLHRAMLGSLERFIGILLEETGGDLPLWLAPVQAVVMNITDAQAEYVKAVTLKLRDKGIRANIDLRNEKIGFKIREHSIARVPFMLVIGNREAESNMVTVRTREAQDLGLMSIEEVLAKFIK